MSRISIPYDRPVERTLCLIKPDAVGALNADNIKQDLQDNGLLIVAQQVLLLTIEQAEQFYGEHKGKPFFHDLVGFMTSGQIYAIVLEARDAISKYRQLLGPTNSLKAKESAPNSLRAKYGTDGQRNACHGSDSVASAEREIKFFFPDPLPVERTLAMIKPDAVSAGHVDAMIEVIQSYGFIITNQVTTQLSLARAQEFYREHEGKSFYAGLTQFMSSGPIVALALCRTSAISVWRQVMGPTNSLQAKKSRPWCMRSLFGTDGRQNACHGSDSPLSAWRELRFFFPTLLADPLPSDDQCRDFLLRKAATVGSSGLSSFAAGKGYYPETTLNNLLLQGLTQLCKEKPTGLEAIRWLGQWLARNNPNKPIVEEPADSYVPAAVSVSRGTGTVVRTSAGGAMLVQEPEDDLEKLISVPYMASGAKAQYPVSATAASTAAPKAAGPTVEPYVVFVLGGPGSGKGTQCAKIVKEFGYVHLSAGDLLREEANSGSKTGQMVTKMMQEGAIVPVEVTLELLRKAIHRHMGLGSNKFLVDGFPRSMDQGVAFEKAICPCQFVLFFDAADDTLKARLMERGKTSGRVDDNEETIAKRLVTYKKQTMPVIESYEKIGKVRKVSAEAGVDEVYQQVRKLFVPQIVFVLGGPGSGKGTQCDRLKANFGFTHLSTGDLIRNAMAAGDPEALSMKVLMDKGQLVPSFFVLNLVQREMKRSGKTKFLIDGFPRELGQAFDFERKIGEAASVLFFNCSRATMEQRLLSRGKTSGRSDDNIKTIQKRLKTFVDQSVPVVEHYRKLGKVREVSSEAPPAEVFEEVKKKIQPEIVCVIGMKSSGKTTIAKQMAQQQDYTYIHLDSLIASEVDNETVEGREIAALHAGSKLMPDALVVQVLKKAINSSNVDKFVIEGFPKSLEQAALFEQDLCPINSLLVLNCSSAICVSRAPMSTPSHFFDVNDWNSTSIPLSRHYSLSGRCLVLDATQPPEQLVDQLKKRSKPRIVFVLGGPGSGKGTQCAKLVSEFGYQHVSTGDILRATTTAAKHNASKGDSAGRVDPVAEVMKKGGLVPTEMVLDLLKRTMLASRGVKFLVDGFPRELAQVHAFEGSICSADSVLSFECDDEELLRRILERAEKAAVKREDDNEETIRARLETFKQQSEPVINYFKELRDGRLQNINAARPIGDIYQDARRSFLPSAVLFHAPPGSGVEQLASALCLKYDMVFIDLSKLYDAAVARKDEQGVFISRCFELNQQVPIDVTIGLLRKEMNRYKHHRFLLAGLPRHIEDSFPYVHDQVMEISEKLCNIVAVCHVTANLDHCAEKLVKSGLSEAQASAQIQQYQSQIVPSLPFFRSSYASCLVEADASASIDHAIKKLESGLSSHIHS